MKSPKKDYINYRINTAKETLNAELFDYRQAADYADFVDFDENKTSPLFTPVEELLQKIENLLNE